MEERPLKALSKSPPRRGSERPNPHPDIRNRWTMASMSQTQMDVPLSEVCDKYYEEVMVPDDSTRGRSSLKGHWKEDGESISLSDKVNFKREELELSSSVSLQDQVEVDDYSDLESSSSISVISISKYTPHRAYWAEQQNRLPLPLVELMENEALEILNKALKSYRSLIGKDHFMTKELQRYVEGLRRRKNKRLNSMFQ
ncbi:cation channel sperm-associated auxiliary subunit zeta isoform X2 [Sciurus carolinensis]|uniref:cation channel sperm-associated auxiliary subunit zeta isoform X2 n=1 Tax=Sciurus carolinensis TaxID=30640 RepID=UPI001FB51E22|nr:cation channel sperm-associated auxiliary subunit zeta isoform X2 [Sciurus carolinensis]